MKTVSLFSGGGGLDIGFKEAGFDIIWAIDNEENAVETYKYNIGDHIIHADINNIDIEEIPKADVVIGGPPCQAFSLSGKRDKNDPRAQLVWKYLECLEKIQPKAFIFENVIGLLSAKDKEGNKVVDSLTEAFKELGYNIFLKILNAADYGVPQKRRRVIIVGFKDLEEFEFPKPKYSEDGKNLKKCTSVKDALSDLGTPVNNQNDKSKYLTAPQTEYQKIMRKSGLKEVTDHVMPTMSELDKYICKHVKPGGNYMDIPSDVESKRIQRLQKDGGHTTCYGRMDPDRASYTINTYFNRPNVGCNIHYKYDRLITVREALRIQSFKDDYHIVSKTKKARNLIVGNAVPPLLAREIATSIREALDKHIKD